MNKIPQVGDARVDDRCSEGSIEASAEKRVTLASDRKYPATDALAGTAGALLAAADALDTVNEGDFAERLRSGLETQNYNEAIFREYLVHKRLRRVKFCNPRKDASRKTSFPHCSKARKVFRARMQILEKANFPIFGDQLAFMTSLRFLLLGLVPEKAMKLKK